MSDPTQSGQATPGWYPDPTNGQLRWWDGQQWGQYAEGAQAPAVQPVMAGVAGGLPADQARNQAGLAHLLGAFLGWVGPLIILLTSGAKDPFVKDQATEALNFHITLAGVYIILYIVGFVLLFVLVGIFVFLLIPVVWVVQLVYGFIGYQAANKGEYYRYPFAVRMVKP
jgi:uncharacterized Tic20 family protein